MQFFICLVLEKLIIPFCGNNFVKKCFHESLGEIILYWSNKDKAFIAEVPELPGCMADGITYRGALENVELIIQEWIETAEELGRIIPEPKGKLIYA